MLKQVWQKNINLPFLIHANNILIDLMQLDEGLRSKTPIPLVTY